jgi:asparagine synthase (glutamine-hydrolysing)
MCGIAGFVASEDTGSVERRTRVMVSALSRRGPDAEGLESWPGVALGHRRLAILDLSDAGRQPMLSPDRNIGIVFNGCIYNFHELRAELERCGCVFRSQCDTEVLLHGYREWGIDKLAKCIRGMYAFGVWDQPHRRLTLVRDRLGVKPLVYVQRNGGIAFASTIDALRAAKFTSNVSPNAVLEFLEYGFVTEDSAIFENVRKLQPATILEWHDGRISERTYWDLPEAGSSGAISFDEAVEETERLLIEAVRLRLCSDVPIGALLSGGIDSTLVCWAMAKLDANVKAFTMAAPGDAEDETEAASATARLIGVPHEIVALPQTKTSQMDEMVEAYSEPFASQSAQGMLLLSRTAKQSATVLLTGDGADDVFLGYPFMRNAWRAHRLAQHLPASAAAGWAVVRSLMPGTGVGRQFRNLMDYSTGGIGPYARVHNGLPWYQQRSLLGDRLVGRQLQQRTMEASPAAARRLFPDVLEFHRKMHFTSEFMQKVDGATMYHAMEARSPFLDQRIWEFAASLPFSMRFHNGELKAILREIVRRRVGPEVAARKKQGFTVPMERWLVERWSGSLNRLKTATLLEREGWIQPGRLNAAIDDALNKRWAPVQLWYLLMLERWLERNARGEEVSLAATEEPLTLNAHRP